MADIFKYFDDGKIMFSAWKEQPIDYFKMLFGIGTNTGYFEETYFSHMNHWTRVWEVSTYNDNRTMIRLNALFHLFSMGNIHIHNVFCSFLSFTGLIGIYAFFKDALYLKKITALLLFFVPSVLFWSSGILKESFLLFLMGGFLFSYKEILDRKPIYIFSIFFCAVVLFFLKTYILFLLAPLLLAHFIGTKSAKTPPIVWYFIVLCVLFGISLYLQPYRSYNLYYNMFKKQEDFIGLAEFMKSGSVVEFTKLKDWSVFSFVETIPQALKISIILKWPWEPSSLMEKLGIYENYILLLVTLMVIILKKKHPFKNISQLWLCLFLVIGIFLLIGWTTPVIGAVVRYRVPVLPFWILIIGMFNSSYFERIEQYKFISWITQKQPL